MKSLKKITLSIVVFISGCLTLGSVMATIYGIGGDVAYEDSVGTYIFMVVLFGGLMTWAIISLVRARQPAQQLVQNTPQVTAAPNTAAPQERSPQAPAVTQSALSTAQQSVRRVFTVQGQRELASRLRIFTNSSLKYGHYATTAAALLWAIIAVAPIITTLVQANELSYSDPSASGPVGMVVFATVFLAPVYALAIAGWLAIPGFILSIKGAVEAKWKLHPREVLTLVLATAMVALAFILLPRWDEIGPIYGTWFS